jgi:hypothetical protein
MTIGLIALWGLYFAALIAFLSAMYFTVQSIRNEMGAVSRRKALRQLRRDRIRHAKVERHARRERDRYAMRQARERYKPRGLLSKTTNTFTLSPRKRQ